MSFGIVPGLDDLSHTHVLDNSGNGSLDVSPNLDLSHSAIASGNESHLLSGNTAGNVTTAAPVTADPSTLNDATTALPVNVSDLTGTVNGLTSNLMGGSPNGLGL